MSAKDDALAVSWWYHGQEADEYVVRGCSDALLGIVPDYGELACIEAAMVSRGQGERYGRALLELSGLEDRLSLEDAAAIIRTLPLEVCLRALARVVREQQPKVEGILRAPSPEEQERLSVPADAFIAHFPEDRGVIILDGATVTLVLGEEEDRLARTFGSSFDAAEGAKELLAAGPEKAEELGWRVA